MEYKLYVTSLLSQFQTHFFRQNFISSCVFEIDRFAERTPILNIEAVEQIDTTGEEMLAHVSEWFKEAGIEFYITRPKFKVTDVLKRTGLYDKIGEEHIYKQTPGRACCNYKKYGTLVDIVHLQCYMPVDKTQ